MKILILNPILYTSETNRIPEKQSIKDTMIYSMCMGFLCNGDEPTLVAAREYKPVQQEEYPFPVVWLPCCLKKLFQPRCLPYLKGLNHYLKENRSRFDYIISSEAFSIVSLSAAMKAPDKTLIWHELGAHNNLMKKIPSKVWYNIVPRLLMKKVLIVPRSQRAREFIKHYTSKVSDTMIDHGVDIQKIEYSREKENYFIVVSQLIERKQIDGIIDKFTQFYQAGNNQYSLKIFGDGVLRDKLEKQVQQLGMQDSIHFYGSISHEQLSPILKKAKALLVNTNKDNNMVSIAESIAAGTPVLSTDVPFNASYVNAFELGIAKKQWGIEELRDLCIHNKQYVENCLSYREKLSNTYCAQVFNHIAQQSI